MAQRTPFIGGNWKMNLDLAGVRELCDGLKAHVADAAVDVAVFPAMAHLAPAVDALQGSGIRVGAQNVWHEPNGAYTGEVSLAMLTDLGIDLVLLGHSERRHVIGESDELINKKVRAALGAGFHVDLAIGELLEQREAGETDRVNAIQLDAGLKGVTAEQMSRVTIAYEPVWAIGTGKTATPEDAQSAHAAIREKLGSMFDADTAAGVRIQYGGSMKPANAGELLAQPDIDGGLIGGASLKAEDFAAIVDAAR